MDKRTRDLVTETAIKVLVPHGWKGLARKVAKLVQEPACRRCQQVPCDCANRLPEGPRRG